MNRDRKGRFMSNETPTGPSNTYLLKEVSRLDREMVSLAASNVTMSENMSRMADSIASLARDTKQGFDDFARERANANKTNWTTLIAIGTLIIMIVGGLYGLVSSSSEQGRLNNLKAIEEVKGIVYEHMKGGHPSSVIDQIAALKERLNERIDTVDQKANQSITRSEHRFTRLDWETERAKIFNVMDDSGKRITEHMSSVGSLNSRQDTDLEWIKSELKTLNESIHKLEDLERLSSKELGEMRALIKNVHKEELSGL